MTCLINLQNASSYFILLQQIDVQFTTPVML